MSDGAPSTDRLVMAYLAAKREVVEKGFCDEIAWQSRAGDLRVTSQSFLQEAAWVVLNTGMREAVIRRRFPELRTAFFDFEPEAIARNAAAARAAALGVFRHERKIDSILAIAGIVRSLDESALERQLETPERFLRSLPYIGPVTWRHLAKNLGVPVAKADRHLVRVAQSMNRSSVESLCSEISVWLGEPIPVVDVVLWRWSVLHGDVCRAGCSALHGLCPRAGDVGRHANSGLPSRLAVPPPPECAA